MKTVILINAYPINDRKKNILKYQISNLKKLNLPIVLCSGCDLDQDVIDSVSYHFINKEKILRPVSYQKEAFLNGETYVGCLCYTFGNRLIAAFENNVDPTIAKNTKLLFEKARELGFDNALYTEDDAIIDHLNYYTENLNILNVSKDQIKMCIPKCDKNPILFTNSFFSDISFFLENFRNPISIEELNNPEIRKELMPFQIYERVFYRCFFSKEKQIHFIPNSYATNLFNKSYLFDRRNDINFCLKNDCFFCLCLDQKVNLYCINNYTEDLIIKIKKNGQLYYEHPFARNSYFSSSDIDLNDCMEIELLDKNGNSFSAVKPYLSKDDISAVFFQ